jgi:hypothetical protein
MSHHFCIECDNRNTCTEETVFGDYEKPPCYEEKQYDYCDKCQHYLHGYCKILDCFTDANGPNYPCGEFDLRREYQ